MDSSTTKAMVVDESAVGHCENLISVRVYLCVSFIVGTCTETVVYI